VSSLDLGRQPHQSLFRCLMGNNLKQTGQEQSPELSGPRCVIGSEWVNVLASTDYKTWRDWSKRVYQSHIKPGEIGVRKCINRMNSRSESSRCSPVSCCSSSAPFQFSKFFFQLSVVLTHRERRRPRRSRSVLVAIKMVN
jgi:hypothetical protein